MAWDAVRKLWRVWKSNLVPRPLKVRVFRTCVESVILYDSETWSLNAEQTRRLDGAYTRLLRKALDEWYPVTNDELYGRTPGSELKIAKVSDTLRRRRLRFAGHCLRRKEQPAHRLVLWECPGQYWPGAQARMTYPRKLLNDTGYDNLGEMAKCMEQRDRWKILVRSCLG